MSRKVSVCVFDDFVVGASTVFTSPEHNELLARHERMSFQMIVDQVTGTSPTGLLQQQHSSDNRNWVDKQTAEIPATSLNPAITNVLNGYELGTNPSHGFVRLKIVLGGTTPQAHVKVWVTGRDLL